MARFSLKDIESYKKRRNKLNSMSNGEIIAILTLFHLSGYRCLKYFYLQYVCVHQKSLFPSLVSYNRFVELQQKVVLPMICFIKTCLLGECTGISFVDSTRLAVCRNQRIYNHKVFRDITQRGNASMGWFYGFKLHVVCNGKGEIINFVFISGNMDDREPLTSCKLLKDLLAKLGYIGQGLFNKLFFNEIHLLTTVQKNMKYRYITLNDRITFRKQAIIESINDELKNICQIEHTRHRSFNKFITNLILGIAAYCFLPKKPAIKVKFEKQAQLFLF